MPKSNLIEERISIPNGSLSLSGILSYPETATPQAGILLCPPHPSLAGNMDNNVILALARGLAKETVTLRFDYRGIGDSQIDLPADTSVFDYWDELEEACDDEPAIDDGQAALQYLVARLPICPVIIIGYSFGVVVGVTIGLRQPRVAAIAGIAPPLARVSLDMLTDTPTPCLLLSGDDDFVYSAEENDRLARLGGVQLTQELWSGIDHFFRGDEDRLCQRLTRFYEKTRLKLWAKSKD